MKIRIRDLKRALVRSSQSFVKILIILVNLLQFFLFGHKICFPYLFHIVKFCIKILVRVILLRHLCSLFFHHVFAFDSSKYLHLLLKGLGLYLPPSVHICLSDELFEIFILQLVELAGVGKTWEGMGVSRGGLSLWGHWRFLSCDVSLTEDHNWKALTLVEESLLAFKHSHCL